MYLKEAILRARIRSFFPEHQQPYRKSDPGFVPGNIITVGNENCVRCRRALRCWLRGALLRAPLLTGHSWVAANIWDELVLVLRENQPAVICLGILYVLVHRPPP